MAAARLTGIDVATIADCLFVYVSQHPRTMLVTARNYSPCPLIVLQQIINYLFHTNFDLHDFIDMTTVLYSSGLAQVGKFKQDVEYVYQKSGSENAVESSISAKEMRYNICLVYNIFVHCHYQHSSKT